MLSIVPTGTRHTFVDHLHRCERRTRRVQSAIIIIVRLLCTTPRSKPTWPLNAQPRYPLLCQHQPSGSIAGASVPSTRPHFRSHSRDKIINNEARPRTDGAATCTARHLLPASRGSRASATAEKTLSQLFFLFRPHQPFECKFRAFSKRTLVKYDNFLGNKFASGKN